MKTEEEMEKDYYAKQAESYKAQLEQIQKNYNVLLKVFFVCLFSTLIITVFYLLNISLNLVSMFDHV